NTCPEFLGIRGIIPEVLFEVDLELCMRVSLQLAELGFFLPGEFLVADIVVAHLQGVTIPQNDQPQAHHQYCRENTKDGVAAAHWRMRAIAAKPQPFALRAPNVHRWAAGLRFGHDKMVY